MICKKNEEDLLPLSTTRANHLYKMSSYDELVYSLFTFYKLFILVFSFYYVSHHIMILSSVSIAS